MVQLSIPEVASVPLKAMSTAWLYQVPWSGARVGAPDTPVGEVASYLKLKLLLPVLPALSVQVVETEADVLSGPL